MDRMARLVRGAAREVTAMRRWADRIAFMMEIYLMIPDVQ